MSLKYLPQDARIDALVRIAMDMTQNVMLRAYEIVEFEKRPLNDVERRSLDAMAHYFGLAKSDMRKLKKKSAS